jgi:hypothetical protein
MLRWKRPEASHTNEMRSRCCGSIGRILPALNAAGGAGRLTEIGRLRRGADVSWQPNAPIRSTPTPVFSDGEARPSACPQPGIERLPHALAGQRVAQRLVVAGVGTHGQELLDARRDLGLAPAEAERPGR